MSDVRERSLANFSERRKAEVQLRRILLPKLSKKSGRPQNEGLRSPRNGAKGLYRYGMLAISALETPLSDFLDSFSTHISSSPWA